MSRFAPHWSRMALLYAVLLGALLTLTFAPFDQWWLGLVSLAGLTGLLHGTSVRQGALRAGAFGLGLFATGTSWIYVPLNTYGGIPLIAAVPLTLLFAGGLALFYALFGALYRTLLNLRPGAVSTWSEVLAFAGLWTLCELFRGWVLTGFPWLLVGSAHLTSPLASYAPLGGVFLISALMALSGAVLWHVLRKATGWTRRINLSIPVILIWVLGALLPLQWATPSGHALSVALVQGNLPQEMKWTPAGQSHAINTYMRLTQAHGDVDLVIWPETALPMIDTQALPILERTQNVLSPRTALISGLLTHDDERRFYNSVVGLPERAAPGPLQHYQKSRLVPFGEYIPFGPVLGKALEILDLANSPITAGVDQPQPITLHGLRLGVAICYEIIFPDLVRQRAEEADVLMTVTNDTWFGHSIGPLQHMQMAQMRALENNRYLLRAASNGVTAIVDADGRQIDALPRFTADVLVGTVRGMQGHTPYTYLGNWPVILLSCLACGYSVYRLLRMRRASTPQ